MTTLTDTDTERESALTREPALHDYELLFKEARRRQRRRRLKFLALALSAVVVAGLVVGVTHRAFASSANGGAPVGALATGASAKVVTCQGATVARPTTLIISCADANTQLTKTRWSTWTATRAVGTTTFAVNLCKPYCAASKMSYFPGSTVQFSRPLTTTHGRLFSLVVVHYTMNGRAKVFRFSFKGETSF